MKLRVAFLFVLAVCVAVAVAQRQPQRQKSAVGKTPGDTTKICQGLPVPDGYVIIAYMTSAACEHGAYLLKRQPDYENSLTVNGGPSQPADGAAAPSNARKTPPKTTSPGRTSSQAR